MMLPDGFVCVLKEAINFQKRLKLVSDETALELNGIGSCF